MEKDLILLSAKIKRTTKKGIEEYCKRSGIKIQHFVEKYLSYGLKKETSIVKQS